MEKKDSKGIYFYTTIILAIIVVVGLVWWGISVYQAGQQERISTAIQVGYQQGFVAAVQQMFQEGITCQPVPLTFQNQTLNMIAVECLQQQNAR